MVSVRSMSREGSSRKAMWIIWGMLFFLLVRWAIGVVVVWFCLLEPFWRVVSCFSFSERLWLVVWFVSQKTVTLYPHRGSGGSWLEGCSVE